MNKINRWGTPVSISSLFLFLYLLTTNQIFSFDAITNAIACESNELIRWFHANHPLYPFIGVIWFRFERLLGYMGFAIYSLARLNSILVSGALGLLCFYFMAYTHKSKALLMTCFLGSTYAFWHYAVDGRAIGAAVIGASLLIGQILKLSKQEMNADSSYRTMGFLSLLYILMHGIGIFHVIPLSIWIYKKEGQKKLTNYIFTWLGGLIVSYLLIYIFVVKPFYQTSFLNWSLGYAGLNGAENAFESQFWAFNFSAIIRGLWEGWTHAFVFESSVIATAVSILTLGIVIFAFATKERLKKKEQYLLNLFFYWGLITMLFLAFWSPGQEGFRIHILIPWSVVVMISLQNSKFSLYSLVLITVLIFSLNLSGPIYRAAFVQNNTGFQLLKEIRATLNDKDIILCAEEKTIPGIGVLRPYFFPKIEGGSLAGRLLAFKEASLKPFQADLKEKYSNGVSIYFAQDLFDIQVQQKIHAEVPMFIRQFEVIGEFKLHNGLIIKKVRPL